MLMEHQLCPARGWTDILALPSILDPLFLEGQGPFSAGDSCWHLSDWPTLSLRVAASMLEQRLATGAVGRELRTARVQEALRVCQVGLRITT